MEYVLIRQILFVWINCSDKLSVWQINHSDELRVDFNIVSQWRTS